MSTSSPLTWHGGKGRLSPKILQYFPPHTTYLEVFGGGASLMLAKQPSQIEIYNDLNKNLVSLFQVVRDSVLFKRLHAALEGTLYSRAEFELAHEPSDDPVEAARRFMVRQRQSYGGRGEQWSFSVADAHDGMSSAVKRWHVGVERLPEIHERFRNVQIECADWRVVMERYDTLDTLHYLDPPYHPGTRIGGKYEHELSGDDHVELIERLLTVRGMVVLSGYKHESYHRLERSGWKRINFEVPAYSSARRTRRTECIWLSPSVADHKIKLELLSSPVEKMRAGAYHVHKLRVANTTRQVLRSIKKMRDAGQKPTLVAVAKMTGKSREHLGRNYRQLFSM